MKTIKIFLASSEELENDRKEFGNLIRRLDDIYFRRGVHLQLIMWEDLDFAYNNQRKQDEYNEAIRQCDVFIALFYKQAGKYTLEEFDVAKQENLKRKLPQVIIYCRDLLENDVESAALADFKQQLDKELGHFWGRYGTNDKLHLDFVLWLQRSTINDSASLKVENGNVMFDEAKIASMDNLQFVSDNANYQKQKEKLATLSAEIEQLWQAIEQTPSLDFLRQLHQQKLNEYNALKEEFEQYQQALFNTAKRISQMQLEQTSDLIRRAVEAFEKGNIERTNTLLDEVAYEAEHHMERLEQDRNLVHQDIEAFQLQAKTIMADTSLDIEERKERALSIYKKADEWAEKSALDKEKYANLLIDYAYFLGHYGYYLQAKLIYQKLINYIDYKDTDTDIAYIYNNIGVVINILGDKIKALEFFQKALNIYNTVFNEENEYSANSYNNIGSAYHGLTDYTKALVYFQKAFKIRKKIFRDDHKDTASSYNNLGVIYGDLSKYTKALEYHQKALDIRERILGHDNLDSASSYNNIGTIYITLGNYTKALEYCQKALNIREKILGYEHLETANSYHNIGTAHHGLTNYIKALEYYLKASNIYEKVLGHKHINTAKSYQNIGEAYYDLTNYTKALEYYLKASDIYEKVLGYKHIVPANSYSKIGLCYYYLKDFTRALKYHKKALDIRKTILGHEHLDTANSYNNIGSIYYELKNDQTALEYYLKTLDIREKILGHGHINTANSYYNLGLTYYYLEDLIKALEYFQKAFVIYQIILGNESQQTESIKEYIKIIEKTL